VSDWIMIGFIYACLLIIVCLVLLFMPLV